MNTCRIRSFALAAFVVLSACAVETGDQQTFDPQVEEEARSAIPGDATEWTSVQKFALDPGQEIEFLSHPSGGMIIVERGSIDHHTPYFESGMFDGLKPSEIYLRLAGSEAELPEALRVADDFAEQNGTGLSPDESTDTEAFASEGDMLPVVGQPVGEDVHKNWSIPLACKPGVYTSPACDALWFNDNFCVGGVSRYCQTNVTSATGPYIPGTLMRATGMNAAGSGKATFKVYMKSSGNWMSETLGPRTYNTVSLIAHPWDARASISGSLVHLAQIKQKSGASANCGAWNWLKCEGIVALCAGICWEGVTAPACVSCMGAAYSECKGCL
jgi:hypothetical protein